MINSEISFQNAFSIHNGEKASYLSFFFPKSAQKPAEAFTHQQLRLLPGQRGQLTRVSIIRSRTGIPSHMFLQFKVELSPSFQDIVVP